MYHSLFRLLCTLWGGVYAQLREVINCCATHALPIRKEHGKAPLTPYPVLEEEKKRQCDELGYVVQLCARCMVCYGYFYGCPKLSRMPSVVSCRISAKTTNMTTLAGYTTTQKCVDS